MSTKSVKKYFEPPKDTPCHINWVKFGQKTRVNYVGTDVLCSARGCHFIFYNLVSRKQSYYRANSRQTGDGIKCFDGHVKLPILAFTELCLNPRVIIMAYPNFEHVAYLTDGSPCGYSQICFSPADYIITLTELPTFVIVVWSWRTGDKLCQQDSKYHFNDQHLTYCGYMFSAFMQVSHEVRHFKIYDLQICAKRAVMDTIEIELPRGKSPINGEVWIPNGNILILDCECNVYERRPYEKRVQKISPWSLSEQKLKPCFMYHQSILYVATAETLYRLRSTDTSCIWTQEPNVILQGFTLYKMIQLHNRDKLVGISYEGTMGYLHLTEGSLEILHERPMYFKSVVLIQPLGDFIATIQKSLVVNIWNVTTGKQISSIPFNEKLVSIRPHPELPVICISGESGSLIFINIYEPEFPRILMAVRLMEDPITHIRFSAKGNYVLAGNSTNGIFFILTGHPKTGWYVIGNYDADNQCVGALIIERDNSLQIVIHHVTSTNYVIGNRFTILTTTLPTDITPKTRLYLSKTSAESFGYYSKLVYTRNENLFYAVPHGNRFLHVLNLVHDKFVLVDAKETGHQLETYNLHIDGCNLILYGFDGFIFVWNPNMTKQNVVLLPHHRMARGADNAIIDRYRRHIISMAGNSTMVCSKLLHVNHNDESQYRTALREYKTKEYRNEIVADPSAESLHQLFEAYEAYAIHKISSSEVLVQMPASAEAYLAEVATSSSWIQNEQNDALMRETIQYAHTRQSVLDEFLTLRKRLQQMLNENETAPENEKLPVVTFNLDEDYIEHRERETNAECAILEKYLQNIIIAQNKVSENLKERFWKKMLEKHRSLTGLYSNIAVQNFALFDLRGGDEAQLNATIKEWRNVEMMLSKNDLFLPSDSISEKKLKEHLEKEPSMAVENETTRFVEDLKTDADVKTQSSEEALIELDEMNRLQHGTTTHLYINYDYIRRYNQFEINTFYQFLLEAQARAYYTHQTRLFFNKKFNELFQIKERELQTVHGRINRLRFILSELNVTNTIVEEPYVPLTDNPEKIIIVEPEEIPIRPYVSPSAQAILDAEAAENERIRLLLLADDFRERAIMKMMNGVLELRWEDEIKKDIPKPKCMEAKNPKDFTEEDLKEIMKYEEDVKFLMKERERYRRLLEVEYTKLSSQFRDSVAKFNDRLKDLYQLRLKVLSTVIQERFRNASKLLFFYERVIASNIENDYKNDIQELEQTITDFTQEMSQLNTALSDCREAYEQLKLKDAQLEKNYRKDLPKISNNIIEHYFRVLRRRPKHILKSTSPILHYQLAKAVLTNTRPHFLPEDSIEYLNSLDILDQMTGVSNFIHEEHYDAIRRVRRTKIENELRMKGMALEIASGEITINLYLKKSQGKRELLDLHNARLGEIRNKQLRLLKNISIQLVLKQGLVEVPLTGELSDFDDAVLVNRNQIEVLNNGIVNSGLRKLKQMKEDMIFRQSILQTEWQHQHMCMEIEDLHTQLRFISRIKLYRDVQDYLKSKAKEDSSDKGLLSLDQEEASLRENYLKLIKERTAKIEAVEKRITAKQRDNKELDNRIVALNIEVSAGNLQRDNDFEDEYKASAQKRMDMIMKKTRLLQKIQKQYGEILVLQTELELLRLKTYPTLKYYIQ